MPNIEADGLRRLVREMIARAGSEPDEAALVADHLVGANLAGHDSHGVGMVPHYLRLVAEGWLRPNTAAEVVRDDGPFLVVDGRRGYGQRVAREAMLRAVERCRETGIVVLALRNAHHVGRVGAYGEMSIDAGLVSVHFANVVDHEPLVAPFGGREARFSTNPVCIAVPGTPASAPVLLDMATSRIAFGKVSVAHARGEPVPPGSIIDARGRETRDPGAMLGEPRGALLAFGEHKGSGLALLCELLAGAVAGGGTVQPGNARHGSIVNGMLAFVLDPARITDRDWIGAEMDAMLAYFRSAAPRDDRRPVLVPGEPERIARAARARDGIPVAEATWEALLEAAGGVGLERGAAAALAGAG